MKPFIYSPLPAIAKSLYYECGINSRYINFNELDDKYKQSTTFK
jgi:hypothetical protein